VSLCMEKRSPFIIASLDAIEKALGRPFGK